MLNKIIALVFIIFTAACSSHFSEVKQVDDKAYIQLAGNFAGTSLSINGSKIDMDSAETFDLNGETVSKFQLSPGSHLVEIAKQGSTIVKRKIYVTNGHIFEIQVP